MFAHYTLTEPDSLSAQVIPPQSQQDCVIHYWLYIAIRDGTIKDISADLELKKGQNTQDKLIVVDFHYKDNREYPLASDLRKRSTSLT